MTEKLARSGEPEDVEWENAVRTAGPNAITSWHRVRFDESPIRCWANAHYEDGTPHGCFEDSTTDLGLCADHYEEMIGHEAMPTNHH